MQLFRVLALSAVLATTGNAQVTSLDEGSFTILRAGDRVGREDFSIRSSPVGGRLVLVAHAVVAMGARRIEPSLNADSSSSMFNYDTEIKESGRVTVKYSGRLARDHYQARIGRPDGESLREFRLAPGTVAAEDDVIHQLWFIARRGPGATVTVLAPLRNVLETVRVEMVGTEVLRIDTSDLQARHLRIKTDGTGVIRDVWIDAEGHLLKVAIPAIKIVAVRDEPPR